MLIRPHTRQRVNEVRCSTHNNVPDPASTDSADLQIHLSLCLCVSLSVGYGISLLFNYNLLFGCMWTSLSLFLVRDSQGLLSGPTLKAT
jgi:hypothetical protein